ncbi:MAG: hypothetical protein FWD69_15225 [Polyangiaceae bacterium]|nr:hypothetical protein [Polyangiaceae bacterium]
MDLSAVPEPAGLLVIGRVNKPDAILKTAGSWAHHPVPNGNALVGSMTDESIGASVDLSQPIEVAVTLGGNNRNPRPLAAVSVAVRSFDEAKDKLGARHKLVPRPGGQLLVEGIGKSEPTDHDSAEEDDDAVECVLAPAVKNARLVCGEKPALEALVPYLTRTLPRKSWPSDVHVEVFAGPVREPLKTARAQLPILARSLFNASTPALRDLVDASVGELADFVNDANRVTLDAQIAEPGVKGTLRVDYGQATSWMAHFAASQRDRVGPPPPAFWRLPAETDTAYFGRGADPSLFDRPRELLGKAFVEATDSSGVPLRERTAVRELVVGRIFSLFDGATVYGKGIDDATVDRALAARKSVKKGDVVAEDEADRALFTGLVGWHLVQISEPIAKVGPILKDWVALWNRPAFAKWAKKESSPQTVARMRIAPLPAGSALPKETVHLEISLPQRAIDVGASKKKITPKPIVIHVIAVPDQGASWLGFSLDDKLLADRAAASLSTASSTNTLAKAAGVQPLRDVKINGAAFLTLRGLFGLGIEKLGADLHSYDELPLFRLRSVPGRGVVPAILTVTSEGPSQQAASGSSVTTFDVPRGFIEDAVNVATSH